MLAKSIGSNECDWDVVLPKVMMAYRATTHASTGQSPFVMMFGRQCRMPEAVTSPSKVLDQLNEAVRQRTSQEASRQKRYYDRKVKPQQFEAGDHVLLFTPRLQAGQKRKFRKPWTGPYTKK
uniref:Integrase catalytic domain-containing protein n=1 Tax=Trichuris muris TaxID=70415 RepID=A0A5S6QNW7_TRIMR